MNKKRVTLLIATAALLTLSACLPDAEVEQVTGDGQPGTGPTVIVPSPTQSSVASKVTNPANNTPTRGSTPATAPALDEPTRAAVPELVEEISLTMEPTVPTPANPAIEQWIAQAQEDLAKRLDLPMNEIVLISFEAKVWPDGGLGCPHPDMVYKQVQVEGYLIRLRSDKQIFNYHGGGGKPPFLCEEKAGKKATLVSPPDFNT